MRITIPEILSIEGFKLVAGPEKNEFKQLSTDSREDLIGKAFLCLPGERYDGADFIPVALRKGARVIIGKPDKLKTYSQDNPKVTFIGVEDPLIAYGYIARWWRKKSQVPVILITGSVGKTTVKEMLGQVFENHLQAVSNYKNENNEIGVPRTLLKMNESTEIVVIEAGMNHSGELDRIASYILPDYVVITPICEAHIGEVGSLDEIVRAKAEVLAHLSPNGLCVIIDNKEHLDFFKQYFKGRMVTVGLSDDSDYYLMDIRPVFSEVHLFTYPVSYDIWAHTPSKTLHYQLRSPNSYDALNSLAIFPVIDDLLLIDTEEAIDSLRRFTNVDLRSRIKIIGDVLFWVDCYNANPTSMKAALENFFQVNCLGNRILVLGEMKELGEYSSNYHKSLGKHLIDRADKFHKVVFYGQEMKWAKDEFFPVSLSMYFEDFEELCRYLLMHVSSGDSVFLKGSRANKLEEILRIFLEQQKSN